MFLIIPMASFDFASFPFSNPLSTLDLMQFFCLDEVLELELRSDLKGVETRNSVKAKATAILAAK